MGRTGNRVRVDRLETLIHQPVEGRRRGIDGQAQDLRIGRVLADAHDVGVVKIRGVDDAALSLQARSRSAHLATREVQGAAEDAGGLDDGDAGATLSRENGGRQACVASADND